MNAPTIFESYLKMLAATLIMQKMVPHEQIFSKMFLQFQDVMQQNSSNI